MWGEEQEMVLKLASVIMTHAEEAGIWIIDGLDLSPVTGDKYEMICLPGKLQDSDGAPTRAILRPIGLSQPVSAAAAP